MSNEAKGYECLSNDDFKAKCGELSLSIKQSWKIASELVLDAYHHWAQHNNSMRFKTVLELLAEGGAGSMESCAKYVANNATGINLKTWKTSTQKVKRNTDAASIIATLESQGLQAFRQSKASTSASESEEKGSKPSMKKLGKDVPSEAVETINGFIDRLNGATDESEFDAIMDELKGSRNPLDAISNAVVRTRVQDIAEMMAELCDQKDAVYKAPNGHNETANERAERLIGSSYKALLNAAKDAPLDALRQAAEQEAANESEAA